MFQFFIFIFYTYQLLVASVSVGKYSSVPPVASVVVNGVENLGENVARALLASNGLTVASAEATLATPAIVDVTSSKSMISRKMFENEESRPFSRYVKLSNIIISNVCSSL